MTQKQALDLLIMGENIYLTGQAGSGKTFLLNRYVDFLKKNKVAVGITASTGIAATHLNGQTIHSWSGIGVSSELKSSDIGRIMGNPNLRSRVLSSQVLIIDEVSMLHSYRLDMVNMVCKLIRKNDSPFGGLQVILCGDFFQLPPVAEKGQQETMFVYKSASWRELNLKICYLDEQHRQLDDSFLRVLNDIRNSDVGESTVEKILSRLNVPLTGHIRPTRLYTHNMDVDAINNFELGKIPGNEHRYRMTSSGDLRLVEFLKKNCLALDELVLKKGAAVMFVKNNPGKGYVNGTLGEVIDFDEDDFPVVRTFTGDEIIAVPGSWMVEDNDEILAQVDQIPLRLAWAITIHKSQGMSLDAAEIDLSKSFTSGMGYVALSRVRDLAGIKLIGINNIALMVNPEISQMDQVLKKTSQELSRTMDSMSRKEIQRKQKEFLKRTVPGNTPESDPGKILRSMISLLKE